MHYPLERPRVHKRSICCIIQGLSLPMPEADRGPRGSRLATIGRSLVDSAGVKIATRAATESIAEGWQR